MYSSLKPNKIIFMGFVKITLSDADAWSKVHVFPEGKALQMKTNGNTTITEFSNVLEYAMISTSDIHMYPSLITLLKLTQ